MRCRLADAPEPSQRRIGTPSGLGWPRTAHIPDTMGRISGRANASCDNPGARCDPTDSNGRGPRGQHGGQRARQTRGIPQHDRRNIHVGHQDGARPDAQGRRHHGRRHARPCPDCRGGRRRGRDGPRARAVRHPRHRRRGPDERPIHDRGDHGGSQHPGDGQGPHRPLRGGPDPGGPRRRLRR